MYCAGLGVARVLTPVHLGVDAATFTLAARTAAPWSPIPQQAQRAPGPQARFGFSGVFASGAIVPILGLTCKRSRKCRRCTRARTTAVLAQKRVGDQVIRISEEDFSQNLRKINEDSRITEDGKLQYAVKVGRKMEWRDAEQVGTYRFTERGFESRDENGEWVSYAQMPPDTSHLTEAQRERLLKELRGEVKCRIRDDDELEAFMPMAETPPLEQWPFWEATITEELKTSGKAVTTHTWMPMTDRLGKAFFLATRWKEQNEGRRHLGYNVNDDIEDIAHLNGTVLAYRCLTDQLKRLQKFRNLVPGEERPSDAARLEALRIDGMLGSDLGSAMAMWYYVDKTKCMYIDICLGDDFMYMGSRAEELLMRRLASEGAELGAERMRCRTRRSESGKVLTPRWFEQLGFRKLDASEQTQEEWDTLLGPSQAEEAEVSETISGLYMWMVTRNLQHFMPQANAWCEEMGAADIFEVADNKADLAEYLADQLTPEEKERLMKY